MELNPLSVVQKMGYDTILVKKTVDGLTITINRLSHKNIINHTLLRELNSVMDLVEEDSACRSIVPGGQKDVV